MANYEDYQLDEMENSAVEKSKNLKRGLIAGGAILGVGAGAAFAADQIINNTEDSDISELSSEDLLAGANAGVEEANQEEPKAEQPAAPAPAPTPAPEPEPVVDIDETVVVYDEYGNVIEAYDAGTVDGNNFVIYDTDGNGRGDLMAYDENGNGIYEANEIYMLDNKSYELGQGETGKLVVEDGFGHREVVLQINPDGTRMVPEDRIWANIDGPEPRNNDISDITNDFEDEKTGEEYHDDLADNNPDYQNEEAEQYSAGVDGVHNDFYAENEVDYGYDETSSDLASNDTFDEADTFDA